METLIDNDSTKKTPAISRFCEYIRSLATPIFFFAFVVLTANSVLAGHIRNCCNRSTAAAKWTQAYRSLQRSIEMAMAGRERRRNACPKEQRPVSRIVSGLCVRVVAYTRCRCLEFKTFTCRLPGIKKILRSNDTLVYDAAEQKTLRE